MGGSLPTRSASASRSIFHPSFGPKPVPRSRRSSGVFVKPDSPSTTSTATSISIFTRWCWRRSCKSRRVSARLRSAFRIEPFAASVAAGRDRALGRFTSAGFYFLQTRRLARKLKRAGIPANDYVFGLNDSGAMTEQLMLRLHRASAIGRHRTLLPSGDSRWDGADDLPADYRPVEEFRALVSPAVKAKLAACNLQPQNFRAACGV